jgi:hypothetical protein
MKSQLVLVGALGLVLAASALTTAPSQETARAQASPEQASPKVLVRVKDGYVRLPPPGTTNAVAYMVLESADAAAHELVSVSCAVAKHCSLHTHEQVDGMMRMVPVKRITVPASGQVELKPGGLHIMILSLTKKLSIGEQVALTLSFLDGAKQEIRVSVRGL